MSKFKTGQNVMVIADLNPDSPIADNGWRIGDTGELFEVRDKRVLCRFRVRRSDGETLGFSEEELVAIPPLNSPIPAEKAEGGHTPGPWVIDPYAQGTRWNIDTADGVSIALSSQQVKDKDFKVRDANTRLLAAAPELLDVLRTILPWAEVAMENHRINRLLGGNKDIQSEDPDTGKIVVGLWQEETDTLSKARALVRKLYSEV